MQGKLHAYESRVEVSDEILKKAGAASELGEERLNEGQRHISAAQNGISPLISKKDWIQHPIVFESNFLKPDRRHIGRTQTKSNSEHVEKYTR